MTEKNDQQNEDSRWSALAWMGVGIEFCLVVGAFMWLGKQLDTDETYPGFMIIGFFVGFGVMLYIMLKRAGGLRKNGSDDEDGKDKRS